MKVKVGQVTVEERDTIQQLFERKNGLNELAKIFTPDNEALYQKLVKDLGETSSKFQQWWDDMSAKYHWKGTPTGHWEINFDTCDIFLMEE